MDCSVLSNGTLIDAEMATTLVAAKLDSLSLSLDGLETTHNAIRGRKDAYARTIAAVRHVNESKEGLRSELPLVALGCTILSSNATELTQLVPLARDLGVPLAFGYLHYTTAQMLRDTRRYIEIEEVKREDQDVPLELRNVPWEALASEVEQAKEAARALGVTVSFTPNLRGREIELRFADDAHAYTNKCFYPWYSTRVNPYGIVYPCSMNIVMGNVREKTLEEIWNDEPYARFRRALRTHRLFPKCAKCCALNNKMWNYLPPSRLNVHRDPSPRRHRLVVLRRSLRGSKDQRATSLATQAAPPTLRRNDPESRH
jgi:radical SAM protein with 4Fe4S-binding SPASM domain